VGRDLLCKLRAPAALKLRGPEAKTLILTTAQEEEWQAHAPEGRPPEIPAFPFMIPGIWAKDSPPGLAQNMPPVVVELNPGVISISQKHYFIPSKAEVGIEKHLDRILKYEILQPCQSSWNTPLLPVQKMGDQGF
jgi:hypothetical protein